jgi:hypothetical protein
VGRSRLVTAYQQQVSHQSSLPHNYDEQPD